MPIGLNRLSHFPLAANPSPCRKALGLLLLTAWMAVLYVQASPPASANEYELKAAFVRSLIPFVEWPEGALGDRIVVGYAGEGAQGETLLATLRDKRFGNRNIEVRLVRTRAELRACNILFIAYPDATRQQEALASVERLNVLTVGNDREFVRMGGIVAFVGRSGTFQLAINPHAAEKASLRISAKLLSMSEIVDAEAGGAKPR